ncbi:hypothetical protein D3C72_2347300 [compost metagenome]
MKRKTSLQMLINTIWRFRPFNCMKSFIAKICLIKIMTSGTTCLPVLLNFVSLMEGMIMAFGLKASKKD